MKAADGERRLRWAFGLAVLVHALALAAVAHVSLAGTSAASLDQITVFGSEAPISAEPVTLVALPPAAPEPEYVAVVSEPEPQPPAVTREPDPQSPVVREQAPSRPPRPSSRVSPQPAQAPRSSAVRPPVTPPQAHVGAALPGGGGGGPVNMGSLSPGGSPPAPGPAGGGEASPGQVPGEGGGSGPGHGEGSGGGSGGGTGGGEGPGTGAGQGPNPPAPEPPRPVELVKLKVLHKVEPAYPEEAAEKGAGGTVVMTVLVGEKGDVLEVEVSRSSGEPSLDKAAVRAVRQWRYQPAVQDGKPRRVRTYATVIFGG